MFRVFQQKRKVERVEQSGTGETAVNTQMFRSTKKNNLNHKFRIHLITN